MSENIPQTAVTTSARAPLAIARGVQITDIDGLWRFATAVAASGLAPKGIQTKEAIFIAIEMGLEVGLPPMAALQNIAVINGRPSIWGDAQLAVVRSTGEVEEFAEWYEQGGKKLARNPVAFGDDTTAVCRVKRRGYDATETAFSVADAKQAKLWGKEGPWSQYPGRMLRFRARSFGLRDTFGDALKGLRAAEEVQDDIELNVTPPAAAAEIPAPGAPTFRKRAPKAEAAPTPEPAAPMPEVQTAVPSAPEPVDAPDIESNPSAFVGAKLDQYGVKFDDFRDWLKSAGHFDQADTMADVNDLPKAVALKITANGCEFLKKCCKMYGSKPTA
jgi:hypothetical protein